MGKASPGAVPAVGLEGGGESPWADLESLAREEALGGQDMAPG